MNINNNKIYITAVVFYFFVKVTLSGQTIVTFDNIGWNSNQPVHSGFDVDGLTISSNKAFYTNYGFKFNTDSVSLYMNFTNPLSDYVEITSQDNAILNFSSIAAYQVSQSGNDTLIVEGWNGTTRKYYQKFVNNVKWAILPLNFQTVNKLIIKSGNKLASKALDYNFDNLTYGKQLSLSSVRAKIKVFLQGPYENSSMRTDLKNAGVIPLQQPYIAAPWNYSGTEKVTDVPSGTVDWILIELRTGTAASTTVVRRAAFLKSDGRVFDIDGLEGVNFKNLSSGNYYIVIKHRNHLAVMSAAAVSFTGTSLQFDFTLSRDKIYGVDGVVFLGNGIYGMYAGDADANGIVNNSDFEIVGNKLFQVGYKQTDLDLNKVVNILDYKKINNSLNKSTYVPSETVN